jgi:polar amino acid transport system substrate-binding protein
MRYRVRRGCVRVLMLVGAVCSLFVQSASASDQVTLGVREVAPFVIKDTNGRYTGFSIELWDAIAREAGIDTIRIETQPTANELVQRVQQGTYEVGISAVTIQARRLALVDFSQPMFEGGLGILIHERNRRAERTSIFTQIREKILSPDFGYLALAIAGMALIPSALLYFIERRKRDGFLDTRSPVRGVAQSYWWGITSMVGQQEQHPATFLGKLLATMWMFFGIIFISFFTAQVTSDLTTQSLQGGISSLDDLRDRVVVTVASSTAAAFLDAERIEYRTVTKVEDGYAMIEEGRADGMVYDWPSMEYYAKKVSTANLVTVGGILKKEHYGIVLPQGSPLRERINVALITLYETGEYQTLYNKWFTD